MVLHRELDLLLSSHLTDPTRGDGAKSNSISIEKKIEFLESITGKVTNRRSRRWLNDRLLMELVPRLNAEEIRGLFAPPPWGDEVPPSTFSRTNVEEWDRFRNIDMDKEVNIIHAFEKSLEKRKGHIDADKMAVLNGWHRVGCSTREALRRSSPSDLIEGYEECLRAFIIESTDGDVLELRIKDPFHRLLLHGVCEVDAFTDSAFKGNPAAVCLLEEDKNDYWFQSVAAEFNISETCYLTSIHGTSIPRFGLRWFTPVSEVNLCGHATLAAAQTLFSTGLVDNNVIEFVTLSGILTAKKIPASNVTSAQNDEAKDTFYIELDFPADPIAESNSDDTSLISEALNGASIIDIKRTKNGDDLLVVVSSGKNVTEVEPQLDVIGKIAGRGVIVTGIAPSESGFDFYSRYFCPKFGINEDPVCGSAHCSLATYWSKKLGKCDLNAYQASARGGAINIHLDEQKQRVFLRGKAITVMEGCILV
ncbi:uncharacterized protein [Cicer arietinum]|uniref:uncharacterized protein isoform X3 n=1 Tax=Cicer arietinum TaxID=3827 RepID=UPI003CC52E2D